MQWLCLVLQVVTLAVWTRVATVVLKRAEQPSDAGRVGRAALGRAAYQPPRRPP
jgi:hypothetical protein